ncbi:hypothetical protein HK096_004464 [Nowakowskiella sp. JEL0078]|nr:hypothetical protein HK096_004464 [Nowakowskiella sp. JEL0078]
MEQGFDTVISLNEQIETLNGTQKGSVTKILHESVLFHTPAETSHSIDEYSFKKARTPWHKSLLQAIAAGALLSFGGLFSLSSAGAIPTTVTNDPGLQKLLYGLTFPAGLCMIVLTGGELFTSNVMYMTMGVMTRRIKFSDLIKSWVISYLGNFIGSLLVAGLLVYAGGLNVATKDPWLSYLIHASNTKVFEATWVNNFVRGIGCNWLVCLAVFMALGAQDTIGKIASIYIPIMIFITVQFEHCVANQFSLPLALMVAPVSTVAIEFDVWMFLWKNLLPVTLGNIIGGGLFVGVFYSYVLS